MVSVAFYFSFPPLTLPPKCPKYIDADLRCFSRILVIFHPRSNSNKKKREKTKIVAIPL
jgi:hypothetical protein